MNPTIGIVGRSTTNEDGYSLIYAVNHVVRAVIKCGGNPLLIVPTQDVDYESDQPGKIKRMEDIDKEILRDIINKCDGIILPGGSKWYEYDEYVCKYAVDNNIPLLGICAGMQLLAKVLNNNKIDGVDNTRKNDSFINHSMPGEKYVHKIEIINNTLLSSIIDDKYIEVNSLHNYHVPMQLFFLASAYSA
ncbi:MAG TPA: gamma-glutamyl-gamma-aminobutyrate hydrolase family protein, partial [Bacilli bacterium]|nr:gamma-glutamyl-gamma-aminobutyrate hydrolase family protein [Bacilli bacterium]